MTWLLKLRIFAFSMISIVLVGAGGACFVLLKSEPGGSLRLLTTLTGIGELLTISLVASLPITVLGGVIGGAAAVSLSRSPATSRRRWGWVRLGSIWGLGLGSCVIGAFCGLIGLRSGEGLTALEVLGPIGAVAGAFSGALIGAYCYGALNRRDGGAA